MASLIFYYEEHEAKTQKSLRSSWRCYIFLKPWTLFLAILL